MILARSPRTITGICVGFLVLCGSVPNVAAQTAPEAKPAQEAPAPTPSKPEAQTALNKEPANSPAKAIQALPLKARAWLILHDGVEINNTDKRARATKALGLLTGNAEAEKLATAALKDEKGDVRAAAATALGNMHAVRAKPVLEAALDDNEPAVVLASANSLLLLKDADFAYDVYYGVLTGTVRTNKGVVREQIRDQMKILHDKKKIAELGLEQGVGFIPYGGIGYGVVKTLVKSDNSPMRAAAAKKLAHDPDPASAKALVAATQDKNWMVRVAALEAISERGDRSLAAKVAPSLDDDKDEVRFTGAACVAHLSALPLRRRSTAPAVTAAANPNAGN
jgi:HEAT repeat protein